MHHTCSSLSAIYVWCVNCTCMVSYNYPKALFMVINQLTTQVLAAWALGQAPASYWLGSSEAEQRWVTANEEGGGGRGGCVCCWIVWRTTDKLTTSAFIHHTRLGALKCSCYKLTTHLCTLNILPRGNKISSQTIFTEVKMGSSGKCIYSSTVLRYLYFTEVFLLYTTLYFYFTKIFA